ncbi:MAG: hypothetical protein KGL43_10265 [Burkholderiales bacterium]|nr:hypothetical protein [Burkholderiales bacterium]MDE2395911.1 hypothetical protein [Burkholderiales bacterium]MDE2453969.1 hypothetical protein [Burkholderiales bacterium]
MHRCVLLLAALACLPASAQSTRHFPTNTLRGEIVVGSAPPVIALNGRPSQFAPAARIYDQNNQLHLSGYYVGQKLIVNYTHDLLGQPLMVWILTPDERANRPWPRSDAEARSWSFNAAAQTWSKP